MLLLLSLCGLSLAAASVSAPRDVKARSLSSSTVMIQWTEPGTTNANVVMYVIYYTTNPSLPIHSWESLNTTSSGFATISDLIPRSTYTIRVQAVTSKGKGLLSSPVQVKTQQGVSGEPSNVVVKSVNSTSISVSWEPPTQDGTYGVITAYHIIIQEQSHRDEYINEPLYYKTPNTNFVVSRLQPDATYSVRVSAVTQKGDGVRSLPVIVVMPGGVLSKPTNISHRFLTPTRLLLSWLPPEPSEKNRKTNGYYIEYRKAGEPSISKAITLETEIVITNLEEGQEYVFRIRAHTNLEDSPWSDPYEVQPPSDVLRAPSNIRIMATSDSSVEVWWDPVPEILGYKVFYSQTLAQDMDLWHYQEIGATESTRLVNLERHAQYVVAVAAISSKGLGKLSRKVVVTVKPTDVPLRLHTTRVGTHSLTLKWFQPLQLNPQMYKVSIAALKEFVDSQGILQTQRIPAKSYYINKDETSFTINDLTPFTSYNINVTAVPLDSSYRPPATITVVTLISAPPPMVKPSYYGVSTGRGITVVLPQASEEYGPISHYYVIVVPEGASKHPDAYSIEELIHNSRGDNVSKPYIAAKFLSSSMPYTFVLGDGKMYNDYLNRQLNAGDRYRIFVRAVVDIPYKHLYTSSPLSNYLSMDIPPPERLNKPSGTINDKPSTKPVNAAWVVELFVAFIGVGVRLLLQ